MHALLALLILVGVQEPDGPIASPEAGWPQWRGPRRDGISTEKGLLQSWPEGGPRLLWKAGGLGTGWSSPIIVGDRLYISGDVGNDLVLYAFDREGKQQWKTIHGRAWKGDYPGARTSAAFSQGKLYWMNAHGQVACLEAATGKELWKVDVLERFDGQNITWATSECLLVDGDRLIVTPGGKKALMAALDKNTGKTVWTSEPIHGDQTAYTSPLLVRHAGRRFLFSCSSGHGFGADADTGKLLWKVVLKNEYGTNVSAPAYGSGQVHFATAFFTGGCYRLKGDGVELAWQTPLDTPTGGFVLVDGILYAGGYTKVRGWLGVDWKTGETRCSTRELASGSVVWADGRLYCLAQDGRAALMTPASEGFTLAGQFRLTEKRVSEAFAHPVVFDRRLYLRYHDTLSCYDVKRP